MELPIATPSNLLEAPVGLDPAEFYLSDPLAFIYDAAPERISVEPGRGWC